MVDIIRDFKNSDVGRSVFFKCGRYHGKTGRPRHANPEIEAVRNLQPGECVVIPNGSSRKDKEKNWKPYSYGRKHAAINGWRLRSSVIGNNQYLYREEIYDFNATS